MKWWPHNAVLYGEYSRTVAFKPEMEIRQAEAELHDPVAGSGARHLPRN